MANTKNSDLASISSTDGTEFLYASKGGASGKINIDTICVRASAFVDLPERVTLYFTTVDATPVDLTNDNTGVFSGSNGLGLDSGGGPRVVGYLAEVLAVSAADQYYATSRNAAVFDNTVPSSSLLAADTFSTVFASAGASAWDIATVVSSADMQLYFTATGVAATTIYWTVRITPLRSFL